MGLTRISRSDCGMLFQRLIVGRSYASLQRQSEMEFEMNRMYVFVVVALSQIIHGSVAYASIAGGPGI